MGEDPQNQDDADGSDQDAAEAAPDEAEDVQASADDESVGKPKFPPYKRPPPPPTPTPEWALTPRVRPWDRQDGESAAAYTAFAAFRDMGAGRSVPKLWFNVLAPGSTRLNGTLYQYSQKFKWKERVSEYDKWLDEEQKVGKKIYDTTEAARIERNRRVFRDNELFLAEQAMQVAAKILAVPLTRSSFIEMKDGKTIYHKAHMLSPGHLLAATALMKAGSVIGRRALGIQDDEAEEMTPERFRKLFFRTTGEVAKNLPEGAMPVIPADAAVNPGVQGREGTQLSSSDAKQFRGPIERP